MALLDEVKLSLGITHTKMDEDIQTACNACKKDLYASGVTQTNESDDLIKQAVKLYCRYWYNYQGQTERWETAYCSLKVALALCGDYNQTEAEA